MGIEIQVEQGSEEWKDLRRGMITASCFKHVMGSSAAQRSYLKLLRGERNGPPDGLPALAWGKQHEAEARADFEAATGLQVRCVGMVIHPELEFVSASPDGLIDPDAGLEIKCPHSPAIHLATVTNRAMPNEHVPQVQGAMFVTARKRWHFVSFDPRQPKPLRLFHVVIPRDEAYIRQLAERVVRFYELFQSGGEPNPNLAPVTRSSRTTRTESHARCLWAEAIKRLEDIMPTTSHAQAHNDAIRAVHPDAPEIAASNEFLMWLMTQATAVQLTAAEGDAGEVISLLDRYKQEMAGAI